MFLEFAVEVVFHEGGRSERGPEDVNPVGFGLLGAVMWGVEGLV